MVAKTYDEKYYHHQFLVASYSTDGPRATLLQLKTLEITTTLKISFISGPERSVAIHQSSAR